MFEPCSAGNQDRTDIPGETAGGGDGWSVEISVVGVVEGDSVEQCWVLDGTGQQLQHSLDLGDELEQEQQFSLQHGGPGCRRSKQS